MKKLTVEDGPWFPIKLGHTWTVMRRDWETAERPPITFLIGEREAIAVAQALNEVWQIEAAVTQEIAVNRELKPCPFCGNAHPDVIKFTDNGTPNWRVVCLPCLHSNRESENAAIGAWNRRVP